MTPEIRKQMEEAAEKWLRDNDWDYEKYGDRRADRSAYVTLMKYEISGEMDFAFRSGAEEGFKRGLQAAAEVAKRGFCNCHEKILALGEEK
jgi:hypothetical protein